MKSLRAEADVFPTLHMHESCSNSNRLLHVGLCRETTTPTTASPTTGESSAQTIEPHNATELSTQTDGVWESKFET